MIVIETRSTVAYCSLVQQRHLARLRFFQLGSGHDIVGLAADAGRGPATLALLVGMLVLGA